MARSCGWYTQSRLGELERQARMAKRGLREEPHPVPPWEWRSHTTLR